MNDESNSVTTSWQQTSCPEMFWSNFPSATQQNYKTGYCIFITKNHKEWIWHKISSWLKMHISTILVVWSSVLDRKCMSIQFLLFFTNVLKKFITTTALPLWHLFLRLHRWENGSEHSKPNSAVCRPQEAGILHATKTARTDQLLSLWPSDWSYFI